MLRRWSDNSEVTEIPFEEQYNEWRWQLEQDDFDALTKLIQDYIHPRGGFSAVDAVIFTILESRA